MFRSSKVIRPAHFFTILRFGTGIHATTPKKWEDLTFIRNKVAHNNYCVEQDYLTAKELVSNLMEILTDADNSIEAFSLSIADKEAVKKAIDNMVSNEEENELEREESDTMNDNQVDEEVESKSNLKFNFKFSPVPPPLIVGGSKSNFLTEGELLEQLTLTAKGKNFVGLKFFVREVLGRLGYSVNSSYALINLLADKGLLEIYEVENPYGLYDTTAVRVINK